MRRYLLKGLRAIKVLTAGDEPNFENLEIFHWELHARNEEKDLTQRQKRRNLTPRRKD
jgi:hypothetical protein